MASFPEVLEPYVPLLTSVLASTCTAFIVIWLVMPKQKKDMPARNQVMFLKESQVTEESQNLSSKQLQSDMTKVGIPDPEVIAEVQSRLDLAIESLSIEALQGIACLSQEHLLAILSFGASAGGRLSRCRSGSVDIEKRRSDSDGSMDRFVQSANSPGPRKILAVDIGATRTKMMLHDLDEGPNCFRILSPAMSDSIWAEPQSPRGIARAGNRFRLSSFKNIDVSGTEAEDEERRQSNTSAVSAGTENEELAEPADAAKNLHRHLLLNGIDLLMMDHIVFSVPGTVDLNRVNRDEMTVVKNMPSFSPKFRGFDFKMSFKPLLARTAKVSAVADNLAAAMGVACTHPFTNGLVIVLGTAPAVATFFRQENRVTLGLQDSYLETAIWQSWVWFSKIQLNDEYGYCGGINVHEGGKHYTLKPPDFCKIPHHQARIRFALDDATWKRLRGQHPTLPAEKQAHLSEEEATKVWADRLQSAVNSLALKFHAIYGPPESIFVLGGNSIRCYGRVKEAKYLTPDIDTPIWNSTRVHIMPNDEAQQQIHMQGLINSTRFKVKHVFAPGSDPLSRGWTRGGEIYVWVPRGKKTKQRKLCSEPNSP